MSDNGQLQTLELDSIQLSGRRGMDVRNLTKNDSTESQTSAAQRTRSALPPTDSGYRAWLCLFGCFTVNVLIWGFAFSFGVLQEFYSTHEPFASHPNGIAAIGTTATGLMYLLMPVYFWGFQRWPKLRRYSTWASLPLTAGALIGASFAQSVSHLILCQGVVYALAGNALVAPTITYLDEWFVRRKGLAIGIMWAGDGTGGAMVPLLLQWLLSKYGFRWTLRAIAGIMIVLTTPLLFFCKSRLPVSAAHTSRPVNMSFIRSPLFWALQACNITQALGYFLPTNYLPTFAKSLGLGQTFGSYTLIMVNVSAIFGCIIVGALVDRIDVTQIMLGVSVCASVAILVVWGFSTTIAPLCVFSLLYGLTASSFSTSWGGMVKDVQRSNEGADANIVFGLLAAGRGVGSVISGPLSEALLVGNRNTPSIGSTAYAGGYGPLIIFAGCTALFGGGSWFLRRAGLI